MKKKKLYRKALEQITKIKYDDLAKAAEGVVGKAHVTADLRLVALAAHQLTVEIAATALAEGKK